MKNVSLDYGMFRGVIYLYESPVGKYYVGQTYDEEHRRQSFLKRKKYCSGKTSPIDNARKKYGPENFKYTVLETLEFESKEELTLKMNALEIYYIEKYNSFNDGYNCTLGGGGVRGYKWTKEAREKRRGENNPNYKKVKKKYIKKGIKHTPVQVFTLDGVKINNFNSIKDAAKFYNLYDTNIVKVCRGKLASTGGLVFKYINE